MARAALRLRYLLASIGRVMAICAPAAAASACWAGHWNDAAGYGCLTVAGAALWLAAWIGDPAWSKP